ncbi:hypothetical protein SNOUR_01790 [Streptomyces noursei ATCC 11455]|uniref:hypothetical protein n=1 Tax=Streptomyces noursei TaxID=1971 RepID=UPI00081C8358|nr:hypothetical protein SNOUR_01790 [Streptomyces noursei ATCC 11455]
MEDKIRRLKVCTVRPTLPFPHAVQAIKLKRRRTHRTTGETTFTSPLRSPASLLDGPIPPGSPN